MIRIMLLSVALLFSSSAVLAAEQEADTAAGVWQTASGGYVQLYKDGGVWKGKIVGSESGEASFDENNPDESLRERRLLGVNVLEGLEYVGNGEFENGSIYDPGNGKTYKAKAEIQDPDTLEVRGFIGFSLLGRSQTWTRIDPNAENVAQDQLLQPVPPGPQ